MSKAAETIDPRRFTLEEYHRMAELGILRSDERVELVRGVVHRMSPKNRAHVVAVTGLYQRLVRELSGRAAVFQEAPVKLAKLNTELEPDIVATSSPDIEDYGSETVEPLLVIEVSESSLVYDLNAKALLYAEARVPEYWVVNLVDRELVVFRSPDAGAYRDRQSYRSGDQIQPESWPDVVIDVAELYPRKTST